jgi:hypothetical protein
VNLESGKSRSFYWKAQCLDQRLRPNTCNFTSAVSCLVSNGRFFRIIGAI